MKKERSRESSVDAMDKEDSPVYIQRGVQAAQFIEKACGVLQGKNCSYSK